jgi:hypothetical protein
MRNARQRKATRSRLTAGRYMLLTHGEGYSLDDGTAIRRTTAENLLQGELFSAAPCQRKGQPVMRANDDGLFPGMSQTWRVVT